MLDSPSAPPAAIDLRQQHLSVKPEIVVNRLVGLQVQHLPTHWPGAASQPLAPNTLTVSEVLRSLPVTAQGLVGRENELRYLDTHYSDPGIRVVVLVGFGGVGKTALARHWVETRFSGAHDRLLLGCSFYSQGIHEHCGSSDQFLYEALSSLGDPAPGRGSLWGRGRRLALQVSARNLTVILDGLEPLQHGPNHQGCDGTVRDPGIAEFLKYMATETSAGFCLVTTRVGINDPFLRTSAVRQRALDVLTPEAAEALLRANAIQGESRVLRRVSQHLGYHSLAMVLACELARTFYGGDVTEIMKIPLIDERTRAGRHAKSIMAAYEVSMRREQFFLGIELLYSLGLFDRPAAISWIFTLRRAGALAGFQRIPTATDAEILAAVAQLRQWRLITEGSEDFIDTHPMIREYFGKRLRSVSQTGWVEANALLFAYFSAASAERPSDVPEMEPALQAVTHGCHAGLAGCGF